MAMEVNPIRTQADYEEAMADVALLWGAKSGTAPKATASMCWRR
jgi:HTH-type transcriptional regulator/antitoxin HigA